LFLSAENTCISQLVHYKHILYFTQYNWNNSMYLFDEALYQAVHAV